jgi:hypothetical protein
MHIEFWLGNLKERDHLQELTVNKRFKMYPKDADGLL